jgi:hypothetical protein
LEAPGCGGSEGCAGLEFVEVFRVGEVLTTFGRDIKTTATVTATSTPPMMMKGSELFDFFGLLLGTFLGLRLMRIVTVPE